MIKVDKTTKFVSVMERIRLSTEEKQVLRELRRGNTDVPHGMCHYAYFDAVVSLTEKRLIVSQINYDEVLDTRLTPKGYAYMNGNPWLLNPVNWTMVAAIAACVAAVAATLALFVSCVALSS